MHNLKEIRKNPSTFKKKLKERNVDFDVDDFLAKDKLNRKLILDRESLEQEKKKIIEN